MRLGERLNREPDPAPLRVSISLARCNESNNRRMMTAFVFTLLASIADVQASPSLYASTVNTCTAMANRQLALIGAILVTAVITFVNAGSRLNELLVDFPSSGFNGHVQFEFILNPFRRPPADPCLHVNGREVPLALVRNLRARRYVLRLRPDGSARVTIPRGGSAAGARSFAERQTAWLGRQLHRLATRTSHPKEWLVGTEILFCGEQVKIEVGENGTIRFAAEVIKVPHSSTNFRPAIEKHLWRLAAKELPPRVLEFAKAHQLTVRRITVRNQKSRWGSCSRRGTISLNWRLIQTPAHVQDYIILHELCHLRELNHSRRFWREVESVCPEYEAAESWLKKHGSLLR